MPTRSQLTYGVRDSRDARGDDGERLRLVATELTERGWSDARIKERVLTDPACVHPAWDDLWVQQEIEACISKVRPLEPKPVAVKKVTQVSDDGLPRWLRDRIESTDVPSDVDQNFRDIVAALADLGWGTIKIAAEIVDKAWIPARYTGHLIDWAVPTAMAQAWAQARTREALANQAMILARDASGSVRTDIVPIENDVAASDLRAVQRAIAAGRWRESVQAKAWAGHAVATVMKLDVEADKAKIAGLLKEWTRSGVLVVVEGEDEQRKRRNFIEVGTVAE